MSTKEPRKTMYRDSRDGQFVERKYAEQHPTYTEKERVRVNNNGK